MEPKDGILRAAQVVFARHGFRQTSMATVAEEAALSRQALYHHFPSKEALFAGLVDGMHAAALNAAETAAAKGAGAVGDAIAGVMLAYHRALVTGVAASPYAAELIEESGRLCGPAVSAFGRRFEKLLEGVILDFVHTGSFAPAPGVGARDVASMVQIAARGVKSVHAGDSEARYAQALKRMINVICAGVEAQGAQTAKLQRTGTARRIAR